MSTTSTSGYTYDIDEALLPIDERPTYVTVSVSHPNYGKRTIITSKYLEGLYRLIDNESEYRYQQTMGNLQFKLPSDEGAMKRALARILREGLHEVI